ncbi:carbohydrate ABC transporter permease [Paenibacillus harenae]|uniref:carbohydrate ABC transporter permease n=1 Tax=Paenibacillus harenae TaxID=306543 RepID=UPI00041A277A|nr:carbohydrate ABC transporter permease [Paenibacillus harenae]
MKLTLDRIWFNIFGYAAVILFSLLCLIPFILVISSSVTSESFIIRNGYTLFPQDISFEGYRLSLQNPTAIVNAYGVTILVTVLGTAISVFICTMTGYVLQRKDFKWRNKISFYLFFTTLFNGGLVPWYILCVQYLGLKNTLWSLFIPSLISVWNILIVKGFMRGIPFEITESAKIDGAGDFRIFLSIILPVSKPVVATIGLFTALMYWNDWFASLLFITDERLYTLQYFLYKLVGSVQALRSVMDKAGIVVPTLPVESMKMALTVIVTGPIIFLYPFVQRYFVKGLTIGSVKG